MDETILIMWTIKFKLTNKSEWVITDINEESSNDAWLKFVEYKKLNKITDYYMVQADS